MESKLDHQFLVIRVDVRSKAGQHVMKTYQAVMVPTFIVFDENGKQVWRKTGGVPKLEEIMSLILNTQPSDEVKTAPKSRS